MTRDAKQTERQRRYHVRKKAQALAVLGGGTEIELAWFGTNANGEHVAIGMDGQRVDLVAISGATFGVPETPEEQANVTPIKKPRTKKIYVPESWDPGTWERIRAQITSRELSKKDTIAQIEAIEKLNQKQIKQAVAVINALPDTPDWYVNLPVAED